MESLGCMSQCKQIRSAEGRVVQMMLERDCLGFSRDRIEGACEVLQCFIGDEKTWAIYLRLRERADDMRVA